MDQVADQVETLLAHEEDIAERKKEGVYPKDAPGRFHHMMFIGPPGTGKTTVAKGIATVFKDLGIVTGDNFVSRHASDLVGQFQGDAETNTLKALKDAKGGVLFIDEAHQLADTEYGQAALRTLIQPMGDPKGDTLVVFAGYAGMDRKLNKIDPGLKSRVPNKIRFRRLNGDEMADYVSMAMAKHNLTTPEGEAEDAMNDAIDVVAGDSEHASMRSVDNLLGFANNARVKRVKANPKIKVADRVKLTASDWEAAARAYEESEFTEEEED